MQNKIGKIVLVIFLLIFSGQLVAFAQESTSDLIKNEIDELKQGQKDIQEDLRLIRKLLLREQKPVNDSPPPTQVNVSGVEFELGNNPIKGMDTAPLVLVEFSDYQCPFCARHARETYPDIFKKYIDTGKLRYTIIDNPLPFHKMASKAAEAAHCADDQGSFWKMHDKMINSPESVNDLNTLASSLDLDMEKFGSCMDKKKYEDKVSTNMSLAKKLNISAVPGFIIASGDPDNPQKVKGVSFIRGARPFAQFEKEIDQALVSKTE